MTTNRSTRTRQRAVVLGLAAWLAVACSTPAVSISPPPATGSPSSATFGTPTPTPTQAATPAPTEVSTPSGWVAAATMRQDRIGFDAVLLGDGTVLVVGNEVDCFPGPPAEGSETAEIYDPVTDQWRDVASLNKQRKGEATVALMDGSAMVIGGINSEEVAFSSTKIFSPDTQTWADGPLLDIARAYPQAATLADGRVLVVSQVSAEETSATSTAELYDPAKGAWARAASPTADTIDHLVPMRDGRMFAVGGAFEIALWYETYDPGTNRWTMIDSPSQGYSLTIAPLPDGTFLTMRFDDDGTQRIERLDPATGHRTATAPMPARLDDPAVAVLADGQVMFAGGQKGTDFEGAIALRTTEFYDPSTDAWSMGPDLREGRVGGSTMLLGDGSVLLFGGSNTFNAEGDTPWCPAPMTSVERFYPAS